MYISQVKLKNFRNFKSLDLDLYPGKNVIVGKNNSGKSNIIRAINYVLGEKYPTYINFETTDFHATCSTNSDEPQYASSFTIYVQLKKCDGMNYNKDELSKYKCNIGIVYINNAIFNEKTQEIDDSYLYSDEKKYERKTWENVENIASQIDTTDSVSVYLHVQNEKDTGEIIKYYGIILTKGEENSLIYNVNKNLRDCLITSAIIQDIRGPNIDLRINNYSWYSKMLKKHWNSSPQDSRKELNELNQQLQEKAGGILNSITSEIILSDNK